MNIVLDTNVIVSGTFWSGASFRILKLVDEEKITLIISPAILEEYDEIIHSEEILEKTTLFQQARIYTLQKILTRAIMIEPLEKVNVVKDDPDDDKFLEVAIAGDVKFIISQDKHLLNLGCFRKISILSPEQFLNFFESKS